MDVNNHVNAPAVFTVFSPLNFYVALFETF